MLLIRTDANGQIGLGHLMRCLTIAEAAGRAGISTVFLTADKGAEELLQERGQRYCILHTNFKEMEKELPVLLGTVGELLAEDGIDAAGKKMSESRTLPIIEKTPENRGIPEEKHGLEKHLFLVDSYQITVPYMTELKKRLKSIGEIELGLLEDYGNTSYPADVVINYNIYGTGFSYEINAKRALLGCSYMPLRREFAMQSYEIREEVKNILITTGGSDTYRIAEDLVKRLQKIPAILLHVVCGKFSESRNVLLAMAEENENLKVYSDVKHIWELMADCDAAISAAGTTLYELCAIGIPTVCFSFAENQILPGKTFGEKTEMTYAGDYNENKEAMYENIEERLEALIRMPKEERQKISENLRVVTDGRGADRLVAEIL